MDEQDVLRRLERLEKLRSSLMDEQDVLRRLERLEKASEVFSKMLFELKKLGFPYISKLADNLHKELEAE